MQLAQPDRQVVCVLGEGSAQYAIQALLDARPPTRSRSRSSSCATTEYAILKWFAELEGVTGAPGLDLPGAGRAAMAGGYGVPARRVDGRDELHEALTDGDRRRRPRLVEVGVAPGMALA